MIETVSGDLIRVNADVICHQVNSDGVMGAGVAAAIRKRLLPPAQYERYTRFCEACRSAGIDVLGYVQYLRTDSYVPACVANLFSQTDEPTEDGGLTDYSALRKCLSDVNRRLIDSGRDLSVALPAFLGCGIAGGDWDKVSAIIYAVFDRSPVLCKIVYWNRK